MTSGSVSPWPTSVDEDHREGQEEDQVAAGKRRAGVGLERERERRGERDRAAHARPRRGRLRRASSTSSAIRFGAWRTANTQAKRSMITARLTSAA